MGKWDTVCPKLQKLTGCPSSLVRAQKKNGQSGTFARRKLLARKHFPQSLPSFLAKRGPRAEPFLSNAQIAVIVTVAIHLGPARTQTIPHSRLAWFAVSFG